MENQNKELLKVEHLKKYFNTPGGVLHAVDDVSFSIRAGDIRRGWRVRLRKIHHGKSHIKTA